MTDKPTERTKERTSISPLFPLAIITTAGLCGLAFSQCSKAEIQFSHSPQPQFQPQLQLHTISYHWNKREDRTYNETNPGIFLGLPITETGLGKFILGGYKNTYDKVTWAIGGEYQTPGRQGFSLGIQAGLGTGYEELTGMRISPIGAVFGQWNPSPKFGIRLSLIPHKEGVIGLSFILGESK